MDKPDFTSLNLAGLLAAYNKMSVSQRKAAFRSKEEGIARCENLWASQQKADKYVTSDGGKPETPEPKAKESKSKKSAKESAERKSRVGDDAKIKVLARTNPRREGTDAYEHFEKMTGGVTVGEYLEEFEDGKPRRTARQWLWNTVRDGHVELVPKS